MLQLLAIIALVPLCCRGALSNNELAEKIFENYDGSTPPTSKPQVANEMWIQEMHYICPKAEELVFYAYYGVRWTDPRLDFARLSNKDHIKISPKLTPRIWNPNMNFITARSVQLISSPDKNEFTLVYRNGTVWTNSRLKMSIPCKFASLACSEPHCQQAVCSVTLSSYMYGKDDIDLSMTDKDILQLQNTDFGGWKLKNSTVDMVQPEYPAGRWEEVKITFTFTKGI